MPGHDCHAGGTIGVVLPVYWRGLDITAQRGSEKTPEIVVAIVRLFVLPRDAVDHGGRVPSPARPVALYAAHKLCRRPPCTPQHKPIHPPFDARHTRPPPQQNQIWTEPFSTGSKWKSNSPVVSVARQFITRWKRKEIFVLSEPLLLYIIIHSSDEPGELSQWLWSWWQHHKHCHGYYYHKALFHQSMVAVAWNTATKYTAKQANKKKKILATLSRRSQ